MKVVLLLFSLFWVPQVMACASCFRGDKGSGVSFVPMGPDGKARYYGSRYEKTEIPMTEEPESVVQPKAAEKAKKKAKSSKAKSN